MKKLILILLATVTVLSLCACGAGETGGEEMQITAKPKTEETVPEETTESQPEQTGDENPQKAKAEALIGEDISKLYEAIGQPERSDYAPSCLVEGEDGMLYYDGFIVYTTREGDVETVYYVE